MFGTMLAASGVAQFNVRLQIKTLPAYHPPGSNIYVAGSFNGWNPQDNNYRFSKNAQGNYYINIKINNGPYEYKITRGGWDKVECKKGGAAIENRSIKVETDQTVLLDVEEWADHFPAQSKKNTANKNVHIIDTAFFVPQLNRTRRIWIYLPDDYSSSVKKYPVLYMHDGQNVFDEATAFAGEWGVDEAIDTLGLKIKESIVVAIDHGGKKRLNEYNPYDMEKFGKGEGDKYVDFLVKTLKPFIDKHYRTKKKKDDTFIAGSSMGGLISLYAILKYPKTFGGAGVFSPAFWVAPKLGDDIMKEGRKVKSKIYFYAGQQEAESMVPDMLKIFETLHLVSKSKITTVIRANGKHNETDWRKEFPMFYEWIMK